MAPHTPPADDTGRTAVTFSDGYIPELIEDQRDRVALFDTRMADAMMQYAELRDGLRKLQDEFGPAIAAAHTECVEGECCVCLDELGPTIDVTKVSLTWSALSMGALLCLPFHARQRRAQSRRLPSWHRSHSAEMTNAGRRGAWDPPT